MNEVQTSYVNTSKRKLALKVAAYVLYGVFLALTLVLWRFPYDSLQRRIEAVAHDQWGLKVEVADVSPSLPPGLELTDLSVRSSVLGNHPLFEASKAYLRPKVAPLLLGRLAFSFKIQSSSGSLRGDFRLAPFYDARSYRLRVGWQELRLEKNQGISNLLGRRVSGKTSGEFLLAGILEEPDTSTGRGEVWLKEGSCPVNSPYLRVKTLDQLEVKATIELGEGKLEIGSCQFKGQGFQGTVRGVLNIHAKLSDSTLDLSGQGRVDTNLLRLSDAIGRGALSLLDQNKPLPFRLRGTLAQPQLGLF